MTVNATQLTHMFTHEDYRTFYADSARVLFLWDGTRLTVIGPDSKTTPQPGHTIISLV